MLVRQLSIGQKLYAGFSIVVLVLVFVSALALVRFGEVRTTLDSLVQTQQPATMALKDSSAALEQAASALGYFVITHDPALQETLREQIETASASLATVQRLVGADRDLSLAEDLSRLGREIEEVSRVSAEVMSTTQSFEANFPGIAFANAQINPLTRDLVQFSSEMLRSDIDLQDSETAHELLRAIAELRYSVSNIMRGIRGYLAFRNDTELANNQLFLGQIDQLVSRLQDSEDLLSFEQADYLDRFVTTLDQFKSAYQELLKLHGSERWKTDAWLVKNEVLPLLSRVETEMHRLAKTQETRIKDANEALQTSARVASHWVLGLTLAGVLITALVGWGFGRMIAGPIRAASDAMAQVAGGDGDLTRRLERASRDELGQLVDNFNAFAERIHGLVKATARSTNAVIASVVTTTENAGSIASRVIAQHADADRLAGEMQEMASSIDETARLAAEGATSAARAADNTTSGRSVVEAAASGITQLGQKLTDAAGSISQLDDEAQTIGKVIDVIRGIADQTNLLALNAAIEAARAGDTGRGFAVVASEVRSLANRTRESTVEIAEMIDRLQASAHETKTRMIEGHQMAQGSVGQSEEALRVLTEIAENVATLQASNETIAASAEQQRGSAEHIRQSVEKVSQSSGKTAEEAQHTSSIAAELGDFAAELQALVGRFKLADDDALDFEAAKSAHLAWRARVRSYLDGRGSLSESEVMSHRECMLGRWYYGPGLEQFGHLEGMRALEEPHAALHETIAEIVALKGSGDHEAAEERFERLDGLSGEIVSRLAALEQSVARPIQSVVATAT
ncbi:methyl-accepting chemotaxis protein [Thiorhodococcus minor]|uniref:HAMP domain-containing protein n=1 Tax=Thiorhodococcus minor TaxID=57489 RepID=A0A6M0K630_9GAMM|nr:methyl-accepting chemotaxis protein [Thiorhodococcus minor]NEV64899.1 HAMP domain-containing protein [Thiorhodococcus minor]